MQTAINIPTMSLMSDELAVEEEMAASHVAEVVVIGGGERRGKEGRGGGDQQPEWNQQRSVSRRLLFSLCWKAIRGGTVPFVYLSHSCLYCQTLFRNIISPLTGLFAWAATLQALPCRRPHRWIGRRGINSFYLKLAGRVGKTDLSLAV